MIVKNEEENLPRLFKSIEGCFDEVHITDTGSTDRTVEIAKELGAKVFHFDWCNDFSAARNASFKHVTTDYVMWLDGDDVLENKDAFIQFRNQVMKIADYWIAPYHYAEDAQGKPTCTFARERVFRANRGFNWKYPIHEGVTPDSQAGNVKIQTVPGWAVRHKRTEADLVKDRSRNLKIFENYMKTSPLDARLRYYYGKELFETGNAEASIDVFLSAISDPTLEQHDRILALQYISYAYLRVGNAAKAIEMGHMGLMLEPNRAEYHCAIADAYLKINNLAGAVPFFRAASQCTSPAQNPNQLQPIFSHEDCYTAYPRNQLARIYVHMGQPDRARELALESIEKYKNAEARAILMEVDKLMTVSRPDFVNAKECEDIVITTAPQTAYEFDPKVAEEKAMGGSETALIEMAYWLKKISGRPVKVFNMRKQDGVFDGVEYISNDKLIDYMSKNKPYFHVAWRHNIKVTHAPTFLWCHDLVTLGGERHSDYDKMLCLTPFHREFVKLMQNVPDDKIFVTRNGLKPERFSDGPWKKDPNKFVFSSSPDRGLDRTMRVLDKVREKHPEIKLHVYYGIEHLEKYGQGDLMRMLKQMMDERKDWVIYHGATQQDELIREFKSAAYCVQPSDFIETSMISAMERLCCGVYQVIRRVGGVVDTLADAEKAGMATLVDSDCITERDYQVYVDATLKAIEERAFERVSFDAEQVSWKSVAESWITELPKLMGGNHAAA